MAKKVYDIRPPKIAHKKVEKEIKEFLAQDKGRVNTHSAKKHSRRGRENTSIWLPVYIVGGVAIIILGTYLFFKLPRVQVVIWPKVETLSFKQTLSADKSVDAIDSEKALIPAKYFESSKTLSEQFAATGNASNEGLASGTVTIYNKYNPPSSLTLKSGTRFLSDSGKLFIASQQIVIPAATKNGSKVTPSSVQVKVQAAEGGESYNIAPSNFSIPGLKGTAYYYSIYAFSSSAMTGGYAGKVKKVTDDDIQEAKNSLTDKAESQAKSDLRGQIPADYVLLDNAISATTLSASTQTKSGAVADNFTYQVSAKASALAFKKADLEKFARDYIISQMPDDKTLLDNSFKINYSASSVDISGGKATLALDFSSGIYSSIDKNSMSLSLTGKNAAQINETVGNIAGDQVSKMEINFWPFWVKSAPKSQKAVKIELKFE